jgi:reactive chlorine resistance protein C
MPVPRAHKLQAAGVTILRYGLVLILVYFGAFKFTMAEAQAIQPLLTHSPLMSWLYAVLDVEGVSRLIGEAELTIASLIFLRPWLPFWSAIGSLAAAGMFLITLSFLLSTPGLWQWVEGFPAPTEVSAFLMKDVFLLGAAICTAGEALQARRRPALASNP